MELNYWTDRLHQIYNLSLAKYRQGEREAEAFFRFDEVDFLASIGLKPINVYDYVEDFSKSFEPDWETFLLIVAARRDYFIHEMQGEWSEPAIREVDLPPKDEVLNGIEWLSRIIPKATAFLRGALPEEIMYGCGGDRKFFKTHGIHPADFLRVVWAAKGDLEKISKYVKAPVHFPPVTV